MKSTGVVERKNWNANRPHVFQRAFKTYFSVLLQDRVAYFFPICGETLNSHVGHRLKNQQSKVMSVDHVSAEARFSDSSRKFEPCGGGSCALQLKSVCTEQVRRQPSINAVEAFCSFQSHTLLFSLIVSRDNARCAGQQPPAHKLSVETNRGEFFQQVSQRVFGSRKEDVLLYL